MKPCVTVVALMVSLVVAAPGCTTARTSNTARTGMEQLLISNAIDQALNHYDFTRLQGATVFLDERYLDGVDKGYLVGSLRDRVMQSGARLVAKSEESDVVLEIRSGGIGTDNSESYIGMPGISMPGPMPFELPQVKVWNRNSQLGTAKLGLAAVDTRSGYLLDLGGYSLARSSDNNWYLLGVGPFQTGSVRDEVYVATGEGDFGSIISTNVGLGNATAPVAYHSSPRPVLQQSSFGETVPPVRGAADTTR